MSKIVAIFLVMTLAAVLLYQAFQQPVIEPLFKEPYVAVFGRDSCHYTQSMLSDLKQSGVNYRYYNAENNNDAALWQSRIEAMNLKSSEYKLPIVDVYGELSVRPEFDDAYSNYQRKFGSMYGQ